MTVRPLSGEEPPPIVHEKTGIEKAQELSKRISLLFNLLSQDKIGESSLSAIIEPRAGWKETFLSSYKADNLIECADLLEEALHYCVETAKTLHGLPGAPSDVNTFLDSIIGLEENERAEIIRSSLTKKIQPGTLRDVAVAAVSAGPKAWSAVREASRWLVGTQSLSFSSLATRISLAAATIPITPHVTQVIGIVNDIYKKDPWPAVVGGVVTAATLAATCGGAALFAYTPLLASAPNISLMAGTTAMDIVRAFRIVQRKKLLVKNKHDFRHLIVGNSLQLKRIKKIEPGTLQAACKKIKRAVQLNASLDVQKRWEALLPTAMEIVEEKTDGAPPTKKVHKDEKKAPATHTVKRRESLKTISRKYFGSDGYVDNIVEANKNILGTPPKIKVGMSLVIPPKE